MNHNNIHKLNGATLNYSDMFPKETKAPHVISVTSGKGGVGKTLTSINFAIAAQKSGLNALILDGDMGLSNVDIVLGLKASYNIIDVFDGNKTLEEIALEGPLGIKIIPSGSGISSLTALTTFQKECLSEQLKEYSKNFDLIIIDTGAGISDNIVHLNNIGDQIVLVTTPEPHAMADAYALLKVMVQNTGRKSGYGVLVNMTRFDDEGRRIYERLSNVAEKFLNVPLSYMGSVPADTSVLQAVKTCTIGKHTPSATVSGQAWNRILLQSMATHNSSQDSDLVWDKMFGPVSNLNMQIA